MENPSVKKSWRLLEIIHLLGQHPEGLTQAEIARRLGVNRSTISRNLRDMQAPIYEDKGRLFIDRNANLYHLSLSLHEALALHLATRLLAANMDRQNPHAASALRKLSQAMQYLSPQLSRHIAGSAEVIDELASHDDTEYVRVLEMLTASWATGRKVRVFHRKNPSGPRTGYLFSPYYIEPGAWGRSTYVIGLREPPGEIRTFKVERIEAVERTEETYSIPEEFDPFRLLSDAWGIWYTEEAPARVVLRFSPRVASRVRETHWHRSQEIETCADGSLLWKARIAAVQEMLPWIRGWGADVEVVEPTSLRETLRWELANAARNYGWKVTKEEA